MEKLIRKPLKCFANCELRMANSNPGNNPKYFFFYLGFLSRTFTVHSTAGEGRGYLFNSSLPLSPASQELRHYLGDQLAAGLEAETFGLRAQGASRYPLSCAFLKFMKIKATLKLFEDQDKLFRCKTRLETHPNLNFNFTHQILQ